MVIFARRNEHERKRADNAKDTAGPNNLDERYPAKAKFSSFGDDGGASGGVAFSDGGIVALTFLRAARGQGYAIVNVARRIQKDV